MFFARGRTKPHSHARAVAMGGSSSFPLPLVLALALLGLYYCAAVSCSAPQPLPLPRGTLLHESFAGKSEFRTVNRKELDACLHPSPYLAINVSTGGAPLPDEAFLQVTVSGVLKPDASDWVAMITPSNSRYGTDSRSIVFSYVDRSLSLLSPTHQLALM